MSQVTLELTETSTSIEVDETNAAVNVTETFTTLDLGNAGPQGIQGVVGPAGSQGPSGVIAVTSPITNSGTSTSATIGIDQGSLTVAQSQVTNLTTDLAAKQSVASFLASQGQSSTTIDVPDRYSITQSFAGSSGAILMSFFTPTVSMTISQITVGNGATAAGTPTLVRLGLYTFDGTTATLVARTANDTTIFNTTFTLYTRSFSTAEGYPATYTLEAGTRYGFAYIVVAGTMPTIYNYPIANNIGGSIGALLPKINGVRTGQTDLLTSTTIAATNQVPYFRGS
jgi:hypothetical protein